MRHPPAPAGVQIREDSKRDTPSQHVLEHHPVAHETVKRITEGGGPVFLERVVSDPCASVCCKGRCNQPLCIAGNEGGDDACDYATRANEMQATAHPVAVLGQ